MLTVPKYIPSPPEDMLKDSKTGLQRLILDTARQLLTSVGYAQVSMRKIANKIGYSATSIYLYYGNKDELVHALIDEGVDLLFQELHDADQAGASPEERLEKMCRAYIRFGLEKPEYYEIMYVLHSEYIKRYPAEKFRKAPLNLKLFAKAIGAAVDASQFEAKDSMLSANLVWAQLHGVVTLLGSERVDKRIPEKELIEATVHQIIRSFRIIPSGIEV